MCKFNLCSTGTSFLGKSTTVVNRREAPATAGVSNLEQLVFMKLWESLKRLMSPH